MHQSMCECSRNLKYSPIFIPKNKHGVCIFQMHIGYGYLHAWSFSFASCARLETDPFNRRDIVFWRAFVVQSVPAVWVRLHKMPEGMCALWFPFSECVLLFISVYFKPFKRF